MATRLLVKEPFEDYARGDRITKSADMARVTASHPDHVLREDVPAAKPKRKAAKAKAATAKAKAKPAPVAAAPAPSAPPGEAAVPVTRNVALNDNLGAKPR